MQKHQYVGKTLDDALAQAASDLGTQKENLSYNILPQEGGSLLKKLLFKTIKVEAWIEKKDDLQEAARKAVREAIEGGNQRKQGAGQAKNTKPQSNSAEDRSEKRNNTHRPEPTHQSRDKKAANGLEKDQKKGQLARGPSQKAQRPQTEARNPKSEKVAGASELALGGASAGKQERLSASRNAHGPRERKPRLEVENNPNAITFDTPGVKELLTEYTNAFVKVFEAEPHNVTYERTEQGDMSVAVESPMLEDLLARSDRLSGSYEHVFKRIAQKKLGDLPERLYLNAGNAADKRVENLREMARSMAEKVKQTGRSITVNSKSGQERRIIHVTIDEIEGVATRSIGTGEGRKLVIYSTDKKHRKKGSSKRPQGERSENSETGSQEFDSTREDGEHNAESVGNGSTRSASGNRRSRSRRSRNRAPKGSPSGSMAGSGQSADSQIELSARAPGDHDS